jgi:hypothetical protein
MATMRYTQSAREMIPRMMFSINVLLELFAADCINAERHEKSKNQSDIDCVQHNLVLGNADA